MNIKKFISLISQDDKKNNKAANFTQTEADFCMFSQKGIFSQKIHMASDFYKPHPNHSHMWF